jgi:hypothetical protein
MNRQQQIDAFLLDAHRIALCRLREAPERLGDASRTLRRWREQNGFTRSDHLRDEWEVLLQRGDIDALAQTVCADNEHAAELRNVSPLAALLTQAERKALLQKARQRP